MPRLPRFLLSQSYYHVLNRGNNRSIIFKEKDDYLYFLKLISKYKKEHPFDLYHYCLMPNHIHFLIQTKKEEDFSIFMKKISLSYYHHFKKKYGWTGHFWQNRFKSKPVGKDEYFIQCGKYIELNPVRSNIVENPKEYSYSSYNYYAQGKENSLLADNPFYRGLGKNNEERHNNYQRLIVGETIKKTYNKDIWGKDSQRYAEKRKIRRRLSRIN